ncbi:MAG: hypothetical protein M1436_03945 [Acidobacteria bacterium]|nr:hypothetical protein [Acidobacteriota bacterium]
MKPALLAILITATLAAGDREFDTLVRGIETDYHVRHTRIPLFGVVNFFVKVIRPAGARDVRLAVFENFSASGLEQTVGGRLGPEWRPFIRVISRHGRETTLIYTSQAGEHVKMLIANMEPNETTVVHLRVDPRGLEPWVRQPVRRLATAGRY